jgi:hypothetical protein
MALLYMSKPLPLTDLDLWVHPDPGSKKSASRVPCLELNSHSAD